MELDLLGYNGFIFLVRWAHFLAGITWIGILYYFNFIQGPFLGGVDEAATKKDVTTKLMPRALWWFRWGAMFTVLAGLILYWDLMQRVGAGVFMTSQGGWSITLGGLMGIIMWFNVWFIIWPKQKIALGLVEADDAAKAAAGRTAMLFSRTNTMLSIPMLYAMVSAQNLF